MKMHEPECVKMKRRGAALVAEKEVTGEEYITVTQTDWYRQMSADYSPVQALRNYRRRLRMSRKTLGEKLGVPRRSIAAMERGKLNIDQATPHRLAEVFQTFPERFTV